MSERVKRLDLGSRVYKGTVVNTIYAYIHAFFDFLCKYCLFATVP